MKIVVFLQADHSVRFLATCCEETGEIGQSFSTYWPADGWNTFDQRVGIDQEKYNWNSSDGRYTIEYLCLEEAVEELRSKGSAHSVAVKALIQLI